MKLALVLLAAAPIFAQTGANGYFTTLVVDRWCGVIRRGPTRLQIFCYDPGLGTANMYNAIGTYTPAAPYVPNIPDLTVTLGSGFFPFTMQWQFYTVGPAVNFLLTINNAPTPIAGSLPVIYAAPPTTVGFISGTRCLPFGSGFTPSIVGVPHPDNNGNWPPGAELEPNEKIGCKLL